MQSGNKEMNLFGKQSW